MNLRNIFLLSLLTSFLFLCASQGNYWKIALQKDLSETAKIIQNNHPGMLAEVEDDLGFKASFLSILIQIAGS